MRDQYIRAGQGFLIVYAINSRKSFQKLGEYREAILNVKDVDEYPLVIVANKIDLEFERKVSIKEGEAIAASYDCPFFETSAKSRINVDEAYFELVKQIRKFETKKSNTSAQSAEKIPDMKKNHCVLL